MSHVIAIVDQSTFRACSDAGSAPPGSTVFRSPEELAGALPLRTMDVIRGKLLGEIVENSSSREEAARRLWLTFSAGVDFSVDWSSVGYEPRKDGFGNRKIRDTSRIELIQLTWIRGKDRLIDAFYKKLPKQARQIVDMLVDDGRGIWTNEQANSVLLARGDEVETTQELRRVFSYYKSELIYKRILRKVSYVEFATLPEFAGMSLIYREYFERVPNPPVPEGRG